MSTPSGDNPDQGSFAQGQPAYPAPAAGQPGQPVPGQPPPGQGVYASFGERVGAYLLDMIALFVAYLAAFIVLAIIGAILRVVSDTLAGVVVGILTVVAYIALLIWFMLLEAGPYGQTPGKRILGIRVVDEHGQLLSKGMAVGRYFSKIISALPLYIGFLFPLWDSERRALHDMIVNTRVIKVADQPPMGDILMSPLRKQPVG